MAAGYSMWLLCASIEVVGRLLPSVPRGPLWHDPPMTLFTFNVFMLLIHWWNYTVDFDRIEIAVL